MSSSAVLRPRPEPAAKRRPRRRMRPWARAGIILAAVVVVIGLVGLVPNETIRRSIEGKMNRSLKGYNARIGRARLQPLGLSLTLDDLVLRQTAHPEPAILVVPHLHASVHWKELIFLRVVADFAIEKPRGYVNLPQLREELTDAVPVEEKGWQQAVEAIYPLKINLLRVHEGALTYVDEDPKRPLELSRLNLRASNIRNIHSRKRTYPSPIEATAVVFRSGRAELKGNADFLAEPYAGVQGRFRLAGIPLDSVKPVTAHWNVLVSGGMFSTEGEIEYAPKVRKLHVPLIAIERARIGYARRPPAAAERGIVPAASGKGSAAAPKRGEGSAPPWDLRLEKFRMDRSELELVDETRDPQYRLFVTQVHADVEGLANQPSGEKARAKLSGKFMDAGALAASAVFRPGWRDADLDVKVEIGPTPMTSLNPLFLAYGRFDVYAGTLQLFSEVGIHRSYMKGWVKPLFQDVEIYDSRQDAQKSFFRKLYESAVDVASYILKNRKRDQVATNATIEGPLGNAKSSFFDVLGGLLENAFIKAILPGFDRQVGPLRAPSPSKR